MPVALQQLAAPRRLGVATREGYVVATLHAAPRPDVCSAAVDVTAAFVDHVVSAASLPGRPNPVTSLRALWKTGYVLSAVDDSGVTVDMPPL